MQDNQEIIPVDYIGDNRCRLFRLTLGRRFAILVVCATTVLTPVALYVLSYSDEAFVQLVHYPYPLAGEHSLLVEAQASGGSAVVLCVWPLHEIRPFTKDYLVSYHVDPGWKGRVTLNEFRFHYKPIPSSAAKYDIKCWICHLSLADSPDFAGRLNRSLELEVSLWMPAGFLGITYAFWLLGRKRGRIKGGGINKGDANL